MKTLVAGWFSFEEMGATAGDLMVRDVACQWLKEAGVEYDIACARPFVGGVDWRTADPDMYSQVLFVCGPFGNGAPLTDFLNRYSRHRLLGLNLSMLESLERWNPFDVLFERDSSAVMRPDLSLAARTEHVPVIGIILRHSQSEYGTRNLSNHAHAIVDQALAMREAATVRIDTRLDQNTNWLRTPAEIESLIARMDVVITTRLHGLVLAIKNGVPAVAIDSIRGSGKITRQAQALGWPTCLAIEDLTVDALHLALDHCLLPEARAAAETCARRADSAVEQVHEEFLEAVSPKAGQCRRCDHESRFGEVS